MIDARLIAIEPVAKDTNLYTFQRVDGAPLPAYKPGAHIDLHLPNGMIRQFSLCTPNTDPKSYVVGIKRDAASRGGSRYIFDEMHVGHAIKISAPRNNFPLVENAEHILLIAGGIGITPVWCMAQELAAQKKPWKLYYSCRTRDEMAFLETLQHFGPEFVESASRRRSGRQIPRPRRHCRRGAAKYAHVLLRPQGHAHRLRSRRRQSAARRSPR